MLFPVGIIGILVVLIEALCAVAMYKVMVVTIAVTQIYKFFY